MSYHFHHLLFVSIILSIMTLGVLSCGKTEDEVKTSSSDNQTTNLCNPTCSGLVAHYTFNGNSLNSASDNYHAFTKDNSTQPKLVSKGVIAQLETIINSEIQSNPYMKVFIEADENLLTEAEKAELINTAEILIENKINPAYKKLHDFLKNDYLINSRDSIGIKDIPNGKEYYEFLARFYTTTDLTPEEIHNIGLQEIQRIRSEMEEIIRQVNWDGDFGSFLNYLRTSPRFYYDNGEHIFNA